MDADTGGGGGGGGGGGAGHGRTLDVGTGQARTANSQQGAGQPRQARTANRGKARSARTANPAASTRTDANGWCFNNWPILNGAYARVRAGL